MVFCGLLSLVTTFLLAIPGCAKARLLLGLPLGALAAAGAGAGLVWFASDLVAAEYFAVAALVLTLLLRLLLPAWSYLAALLFLSVAVAGLSYLVYSVIQATVDPVGPAVWLGSVLLLIVELAMLGLSLSSEQMALSS